MAKDRLKSYRAKREPGATPEPGVDGQGSGQAGGEGARFVIQEHHARRLHWDLRLERDGVLVSWALPRGIPLDPEQNRLAVHTEDHPLEYLTFQGEIPKGQYGAGTMTIWDAGTYEAEKFTGSKVVATFHGEKLRGRYALFHTRGDDWMIHRMDPADPDREPLPGVIEPMKATLARLPDDDRNWAYEIKWDGVRALGVWDGARLRLFARSGTDITARYPELTTDPGLGDRPVVLDGEIVALDRQGRPSFTRLQNRMHLTKRGEIEREVTRTPVRYHLFDAILPDEPDAPLAERRGALERLAANANPAFVVPPVFDDVDAALQASHRFGLEGVVVKDPSSTYRPGARSESWLKVKHARTQEVVIGGIRPGRGGRTGSIGSLLLGVPGDDGLEYVGRVGSGFSESALARLEQLLTPLRTDEQPFVEVPRADASDALWVRPELVGEVAFAEWTPGGILRQARWRGLRPDKSPAEVVREV